MTERKLRLIREKIQEVSKQVPGISYFYTDSKTISKIGSRGYQDLEEKIRLSPESVWSLQSITKNISATIVAWLVSRGLTTFETTINPTLGLEFASLEVTKEVTIKNGLSHTTGLPGNAGLEPSEYLYDLPEIYPTVKRYPLVGFCDLLGCGKPHRRKRKNKDAEEVCHMQYCNLGITIGYNAAVADAGLGKSSKAMVELQRTFAKRIGMTDVLIGTAQIESSNSLVQPYVKQPNGKFVKSKLDVVHQFVAADGIFTTIGSLSEFVQFHLNQGKVNGKTVIRPEVLDQLYIPVAISDANVNGDFYGMGTAIYTFKYDGVPPGKILKVFGHGGAYSGGFIHEILYNPESGVGVAILTNTFEAYGTALAFYIYFILLLGDEAFAEEQYQLVLDNGTSDLAFFSCSDTPTDLQFNTRYNKNDLPGTYFNQTDLYLVIFDDFRIQVGRAPIAELNFGVDFTSFVLETTFLVDIAVIDPIIHDGKIIGLNFLYACFSAVYTKIS